MGRLCIRLACVYTVRYTAQSRGYITPMIQSNPHDILTVNAWYTRTLVIGGPGEYLVRVYIVLEREIPSINDPGDASGFAKMTRLWVCWMPFTTISMPAYLFLNLDTSIETGILVLEIEGVLHAMVLTCSLGIGERSGTMRNMDERSSGLLSNRQWRRYGRCYRRS